MKRETLFPGDSIEGLQIEQVFASDALSVTYLVSDPELGTRFLLAECFPVTCARRLDDGSVEPTDEAHRPAFEAALQTFLDEGRMLARLDHPNVIRVLRHFQARGTAWRLHTYLRGQSLAARLHRHGRLEPEDARSLLLRLMDAIEYLQEQEIGHLVISPQTLYITAGNEPLLMGFLNAEPGAEGLPAEAAFAESHYAPPEAALPQAREDAGGDIYRLAAILFHCITGQPPASAAERAAALRSGVADPVIVHARRAGESGYGGLGEIVEQGLRLDPEQRPADIASWKSAFDSVDWRRRVAAVQDGPSTDSERPEWLAPMLLGGFLTILLAAILYLVFGSEPDRVPASPEPASGPETVIPAEETERWQAALRADTVLGYRRFVSDYPESVYATQAEIQLQILDERLWGELAAEDSRQAYQDYLDTFPNGLHQEEALRRIESIDQAEASAERERQELQRQEESDWRQAMDERSVASMDRYIERWPAGRHVGEARALRRQLHDLELESRAWTAAEKLGTTAAYRAYLDAYPDGEHAAEALITLEHLDLAPGKAFRDCDACPVMRVVPAGAFWQGSAADDFQAASNEQPRRLVEIARPFAVGVHEISFAQWDACTAAGGCQAAPADNGWGRGDRPVILVSWNDAQEYVDWLSETTGQDYRLPSESEWEYVARAGEESAWLGSSPQALCEYANIAGTESGFRWQSEACSDGHALGTLPAGSLKANAFGLFDVIGNVAEWTLDCMNLSYLDAPTDGSAWGRGICSSHMTRGGSWLTGDRETRLPARFSLANGDRNDFTGFRVVRTVPK